MKKFTYTIKDEIGIHARPAGNIVKTAKEFGATCSITKGEKSADLRKLMAIMSLGVKHGDEVTISAEGEDEEAAIAALEALFQSEL